MEFTIGEPAARHGPAAHVLRHWAAMGLLGPARRVNGRRRYGPERSARVALIVRAKQTGASLEQIRDPVTEPDGTPRRPAPGRRAGPRRGRRGATGRPGW
ncbi:hypothetical protein GCM10010517_29670 [Streptosporangium fragile]|uniref:HTH merR-type domain-containing protein n=1 Tax=Streptosporangium fragile TaxID=46186 RepID=A0ABN3VX48_9ACTN